MRIALDTNILAYAEGVGDKQRRDASLKLLAALPEDEVVIPTQTLLPSPPCRCSMPSFSANNY
jgi:predicted nucleic acid-binding protein